MGRRKNGEGSWGKKTIKGVVYEYFRDVDGHYTYGKNVAEVKRKLQNKKDFIKNSNPTVIIKNVGIINSVTVLEYVKYWITLKEEEGELELTTLQSYNDSIVKRLEYFTDYDLGSKQLNSVTGEMIQSYLNALSKKYRRNTILKTWTPLKQAFNHAIQNKEIGENILLNVKVPSEKKCVNKTKEIDVIEDKHIDLLYKEAYRTFKNGKSVYGTGAKVVVLLLYSGLRLSEALGLKWKHVNLHLNQIQIKNTLALVKIKGKYVLIDKPPKTSASERIVPIPKRAVAILHEMQQLFPNHTADDYVFLTSNKTPFRPRNIERILSNMLKSLNIKENYTPHSLRHGYGSILLSHGIDIKVVSELLGHSDITTTYNIYIKAYDKDKNQAVNVFDTIGDKEKEKTMKLTIIRIEENIVVCELEDGSTIDVAKIWFDQDIKVGGTVEFDVTTKKS